ncbi:MAG: hypothetical protein J4215_04440 [Candidatus Diapherotrites archaeon]|uniref:Lipoprotein n=1 Tax=Candidatus Iainarchaeum sp. TaxID=3101447 RepID=A0A8T4L7C4_9ARCH|nr:hypothetical protein [Candidatus Diapherotrites archaeon]
MNRMLLLLIIALLFVGCTSPPLGQSNTALNSDVESALAECNTIDQELNRSICITNVAVEADNMQICDLLTDSFFVSIRKDQCLAEIGGKRGDLKMCNALTSQSGIQTCIQGVAVTLRDYSVCEKLGSGSYCSSGVTDALLEDANRTQNIEICNKIISEVYKLQCIAIVSGQTGTLEGCKEVTLEKHPTACQDDLCKARLDGFRINCMFAVVEKTKDATICENFTTPTQKQVCLDTAQKGYQTTLDSLWSTIQTTTAQAEQAKDEKICETLPKNPELAMFRDICISRVAVAKKDANLCKGLNQEETCFSDVAVAKDDLEACKATTEKERCMKKIAITRMDPAICKQLENPDLCIIAIIINAQNTALCDELSTQEAVQSCKDLYQNQ